MLQLVVRADAETGGEIGCRSSVGEKTGLSGAAESVSLLGTRRRLRRSWTGRALAFHIVFAVIGMAMPVMMVVAEAAWLRTQIPSISIW
jgi:hypothetical protein